MNLKGLLGTSPKAYSLKWSFNLKGTDQTKTF